MEDFNLIKKLDAVFQSVYENKYSDFYRNIYRGVPERYKIKSLEDWENLPTVSRTNLENVDLFERIFIPVNQCDTLRPSSGTTSGRPVFTMRNNGYDFSKLFNRVPCKGIFGIGNCYHIVEKSWRYLQEDILFVECSVSDLDLGIKMIANTPVNYLSMWTHSYEMAIPLLEKYNLIEQIEVIGCFGDKLGVAQHSRLKSVFKNAIIVDEYSCSECHESSNFGSIDSYDETLGSVMDVEEKIYPELMDIDSGEIIQEPNREGELLVTVLYTEDQPFPTVRFRTGDMALYARYHADFYKRQVVFLGRKDLFRIKIPGGQLLLAEFERVFDKFKNYVEFDFDMVYKTNDKDNHATVELDVVPKRDFDIDSFINDFMNQLRVTPTMTYAHGVKKGLYKPIQCRMVTQIKNAGKKRSPFAIQHITLED